MVLEYGIPNGTMTINADVFFLEARKSQIRKMLKEYCSSGVNEDELRELINWMEQEIDRMQEYSAMIQTGYRRTHTELAEMELHYQQMKSPCYAVYTRDAEKVKAVRYEISKKKEELRKRDRLIQKFRKQELKMQQCLVLVREIMWGEEYDG